MSMQLKQNILILICLLSSVAGLILIYLAATKIEPVPVKIEEIDSQLTGRVVTVKGYIVYKNNHPAGHIFLTVSYNNTKIQVPLFAGFVSKLSENDFPVDDLKKGAKIMVTGLVDEYKGQLQVIPRKPTDIKIMGT